MHQIDSDLRSRLMMARLPAMPQILLKLLEQCQAEDVGMSALAELIAKDPGMTCKILGVANSSAYHHTGRKFGLDQSLSTLGTDMIKTLVISESVFQIFNGFTHSNTTDFRGFWKHSLCAAVMAAEIARKTGYPNIEEAYLAGLLHDVGRLAMLSAAPKEYAHIFFAPDDDNLCAIEQNLLKMTHSEVGSWLVDRWKLDSFLSDSLLYHHESVDRLQAAHPLVRVVLLANMLSVHGADDQAVKAAGQLCGINAEDMETISKGCDLQVSGFADLLGIDLTGADDLTVPTAGWEISGILAGTEASQDSTNFAVKNPGVRQVQDPSRNLLAEEVQKLMLSAELGRSFARQHDGDTGLLDTIVRSARMLFSFEDAIILRIDPSRKALVGIPVGEHKQRLQEFSIALDSGSAIGAAVLQRKISFINGERNLQDIAQEQLLRVLGSESLVCLPLSSETLSLGVLIGGVASRQASELQSRERFLMSFGEQAALSIHSAAERKEAAAKQDDMSVEEYRAASRGVVHEANNSLSIIKNYLGVLDSKLEKQHLAISELSILHEEIDRVGHIIEGLANPNSQGSPGSTEVNGVVRDVIRLFSEAQTASSPVRVVARTLDTPSEIEGGSGPLKQILVNLVKNAIEAMPDGGDVHVTNNGQINVDGRLFVGLSVMDSGPGIEQQILESLFAPSKTTKGDGHQGLGLSIVHGLVKQYQGLITCRSGSQGTAFDILLPTHKHS